MGIVPTICTYKWKPRPDYPLRFDSEDINILYRAVKRNYSRLQRFICITDDPAGLDPNIEPVPLWQDHAGRPNPWYKTTAGCHRRLRAFAPDFGRIAGPRFCIMDADVVPVADLTPILERPEDYVGWRAGGITRPLSSHFGGGLLLMNAGARSWVWEKFNRDPEGCIAAAKAAGCPGSDQAIITHLLGIDNEAFVSEHDGVYFYWWMAPKGSRYPRKNPLVTAVMVPGAAGRPERAGRVALLPPVPLPENARLVLFSHGLHQKDPRALQMSPWITEHYY